MDKCPECGHAVGMVADLVSLEHEVVLLRKTNKELQADLAKAGEELAQYIEKYKRAQQWWYADTAKARDQELAECTERLELWRNYYKSNNKPRGLLKNYEARFKAIEALKAKGEI